MPLILLEPCPADLDPDSDPPPEYGGSLFFNEHGIAGCNRCGWTGIATTTGGAVPRIGYDWHHGEFRHGVGDPIPGYSSTWCPSCQHEPDAQAIRVPRNQSCPCGSGRKAKKCDCDRYTV